MTDDLKELLGRALGDEPPLRIDREVVLQQGRKRLRRKRLIDTGSVVAAVVLAVVGATTLTNLVDTEPERMPPAASSTQPAPPGPQLPITTTKPREGPPPSVATSVPPPSNGAEAEAARLTALLYATGVVTKDTALSAYGQTGTPEFEPSPDRYVYEADVVASDGTGYLQVIVGYAPDIDPGCVRARVEPDSDCAVKVRDDVPVTLIHAKSANGERRTIASATFRDSVRVAVTVSNATREAAKNGKTAPGIPPVLSDEEVCQLITKVGRGA